MAIAAIVVIVSVALVSVWALRASADTLAEFGAMWRLPWGKQVFLDFYGLEIVLLLWMIPHASESGSWVVFGLCAATMPFLGAMSAAAYWLLAAA
jgi:hypothetical protein